MKLNVFIVKKMLSTVIIYFIFTYSNIRVKYTYKYMPFPDLITHFSSRTLNDPITDLVDVYIIVVQKYQ